MHRYSKWMKTNYCDKENLHLNSSEDSKVLMISINFNLKQIIIKHNI